LFLFSTVRPRAVVVNPLTKQHTTVFLLRDGLLPFMRVRIWLFPPPPQLFWLPLPTCFGRIGLRENLSSEDFVSSAFGFPLQSSCTGRLVEYHFGSNIGIRLEGFVNLAPLMAFPPKFPLRSGPCLPMFSPPYPPPTSAIFTKLRDLAP